MLSPLQLELTKLIGKKELTRGVIIENGWASTSNPLRFFTFTHFFNSNYKGYYQYNGEERTCSFANDKETNTKIEIIGHPATLSDFHRYLKGKRWIQSEKYISFVINGETGSVPYNASNDFLDQDPETLKQIRDLILSNQ